MRFQSTYVRLADLPPCHGCGTESNQGRWVRNLQGEGDGKGINVYWMKPNFPAYTYHCTEWKDLDSERYDRVDEPLMCSPVTGLEREAVP